MRESLTAFDIAGKDLIVPDDVLPSVLHLIPVPSRPFFPAQMQPVLLDRKTWEPQLRKLGDSAKPVVGLLYCDQQDPSNVDCDALPQVGCAARVMGAQTEEDQLQLLVQGVKRFRNSSLAV